MVSKRKSEALKKLEQQQAEKRSDEQTGALRERAMLVRFATSRWYGRGADEEVVADLKEKHEARGDIGTFTKRFMSRERLAPIDTVVNEARRYHKHNTLAWGDDGSRLLPADLFFDYKKEMTAFEMRFHTAVEDFLARFPEYIEAERKRLNGLFRERDYPSIDELKRKFRMTLSISPLPSAEDFRVDLGETEVEQIRKQIEERVEESLREATQDVWSRMRDLVEKVQERLQSSDVTIRAALFDNLKELVLMLPKLNVSKDPALDRMSAEIAKELLSEDIGAIREDDAVRSTVAAKANKILKAMESFTGQKR